MTLSDNRSTHLEMKSDEKIRSKHDQAIPIIKLVTGRIKSNEVIDIKTWLLKLAPILVSIHNEREDCWKIPWTDHWCIMT